MEQEELVRALEMALENHREKFGVEDEQHYQDHLMIQGCRENSEDMRLNHEFTTDVRKSIGLVKVTSIRAAVTLVVTAAIGFFWYVLKP